MPTPIGSRNTRVQILQPVVVNGVQTWNTSASILATVWARIDTTGGGESAQGDMQPPGTLTSTVTVPFKIGTIRPRMRIAVVGSSRVLEIDAAINESMQNVEWTLACREVTS
jgi:head-tail adaptor